LPQHNVWSVSVNESSILYFRPFLNCGQSTEQNTKMGKASK